MSSLSFSAETVRRIALLEQEIDRLKTRDAGSGVAAGDHGSLTGLSDDDHPQYGALAQNETVSGLWTFDRAGAPLAIGASAADQLVDGLNADQVDGIEGASLVQTSRQVNTGDGLDGGGALSSDLTLTVDVTDIIDTNYGLTEDTNNIRVNLAGTSGLEFSTGALQINDSLAGAGLTIASKVLAVGAGDGIDVAADSVAVDVTDIAGVGLEDDGSNNLKIKLGATNPGLQFDGANALELGTPGTLSVSTGNTKGGTSHQHAITASENPGAASALLKSNTSGGLRLQSLTLDGYLYSADADTYISFGTDLVGIAAGGVGMLSANATGAQDLLQINGSQNDIDTVISGDSIQYGLFFRGSDGNVGIGTGTPNDKLDINGALRVQGDLKVRRSSTDYTGYIYVPMTTPTFVYTGVLFSTVGTSTQITAATLGIPSSAKGVCVEIAVKDSGGAGNYFGVGPTSSYFYAVIARTQIANQYNSNSGMLPTDGSGNIYYRTVASGSNTLEVSLRVHGYFI